VLADRRLRGRWINRRASHRERTAIPTLVFLHEGLGVIERWRQFPARLAARTALPALVYDRTGYGGSDPWPSDPGPRYMEIEADEILPQVLTAMGIDDLILVGHSDGGTIALDYAALAGRGDSQHGLPEPRGLRGVVTIGAHAINEPVSTASIRRAREEFREGSLRERLAKYHCGNVDRMFTLWNDSWLSPGFEPMDAAGRLPRVTVPVLAIQGTDDEYGTPRQLEIIASLVGGPCETRLLPGTGHSPHIDRPGLLVNLIAPFVDLLVPGRMGGDQ
jgi:pimeloyl-ACP methyl ester carboxylesterase